MSSNILIPEMELMMQNKTDLIRALQSVGEDVDESTPLSMLAKHIRCCGGYDDCYLATIIKSGSEKGQRRYFSREEWARLSVTKQLGYAKIGILLVSYGHYLIIAPNSVVVPRWSTSWSSVPNLTSYGGYGAINDFDSVGNTDKILAYQNSGLTTIEFPAAQAARDFKACTLDNEGYEDDTIWSLPALGHLVLIMQHRTTINSALTFFFGSATLVATTLYSSTDQSRGYVHYATSSKVDAANKETGGTNRILSVCPIDSTEFNKNLVG